MFNEVSGTLSKDLLMTPRLIILTKGLARWLSGKGTRCQAWWPELHSQNPHNRRERTSTYLQAVLRLSPPTHTLSQQRQSSSSAQIHSVDRIALIIKTYHIPACYCDAPLMWMSVSLGCNLGTKECKWDGEGAVKDGYPVGAGRSCLSWCLAWEH